MGQGRLAIVYFADSAVYETVYKDDAGKYNKRTIPYPSTADGLFSFDEYKEEEAPNNTYTKLTILINKQLTLGRAKTFFKKYHYSELFKQWFIETFFPFIISNEALVINISLNGDSFTIKKDGIEAETQKELFELALSDDNKYSFTLALPVSCIDSSIMDIINSFASEYPLARPTINPTLSLIAFCLK